MSSEEPFGPWAEAMERVGARDPRSRSGRLSWGGLARKAEVSTSAVTNMVYGRTKKPDPKTIQKVADALEVSPEKVSGWLGLTRPVSGPYTPDPKSSLLYEHERTALDELIRAITRGRDEEEGGERADGSASRYRAGSAGNNVTALDRSQQDVDVTGWAARPGTPGNMPDETTGEESQDHPGSDDPA